MRIPVRTSKPRAPYGSRRDKTILPQLPLWTEERAGNLIRECLARGTTHLRTHVDIDLESGLAKLEGVLAVIATGSRCKTVAFPQSGVMRCPGVLDLLDAAVRNGADLVGGIDPLEIDRDLRVRPEGGGLLRLQPLGAGKRSPSLTTQAPPAIVGCGAELPFPAAGSVSASVTVPELRAGVYAGQASTDFTAIESDLEVIQKQLARVPTRRELSGTALGIISTMMTTLSLLFFLR